MKGKVVRKLIALTAAFALTGSVALAELSMTGTAELGVDYNSDPLTAAGAADPTKSKFSFVHEVGIKFTGSGTTDGGLSFGGTVGFESKDADVNEGSVFVSGAFGTLSVGDVARGSDLAGGIADVGMNGVGVDDIVEDLRETNAKQINYSNSFGQISVAFSAGTVDGTAAVKASPGHWTLNFLSGNQEGENAVGLTSLTALGAYDDALEFLGRQAAGTEATAARNLLLGAIPTGTDPYDAIRTGGYEIVRVAAKGKNKESITLSLNATPAIGNRINIAGFSRAADGDSGIRNADGKELEDITFVDSDNNSVTISTAAQVAAFEAYEALYDLGADGKVGGGDDTPNADYMALLNQVTAPVAAVVGTSSDTQYGFGMSFNAGGVTVGLGYDSEKTVSMGMGFTQGDIGTNLLYVKQDDGDTGLGADVSYTMGASTITLAFAQGEYSGVKRNAMGINLAHDLGGGANLVAGFGQVEGADGNDANKASMGLTFAF